MDLTLIVVTRLKDVKAVLRKLQDMYGPEIVSLGVEEEKIKPKLPLDLQVEKGVDPHHYLDSPLCRLEVTLVDHQENEQDKQFLAVLESEIEIINTFWRAALGPDLERSLEVQRQHWRLLEYKVLDEQTCTWIARARRVTSFSTEADLQEEPRQSLLVRGYQSIILDEALAEHLFQV